MDQKLIDLTKDEIIRLIRLPSDEWTVSDHNTIYLLLGMLFGKLNEKT